jgi:carbonic anhydrase/acetyltransferase-like protein (isoleucine patch superfamily)
MGFLKTINGMAPVVEPGAFIAENASLIGDVRVARDASVWYQVVLRGDVGPIRIGARSNIQDLTMAHATHHYSETIIGEDVTVGHRVILHGCVVEDGSLIGMGAIIMDRAVVEPSVVVGAGAVVLENAVLESGHLYAGIPAKKVKPLSEEQVRSLKENAAHYVQYKSWYEPDVVDE